LDVAQPKKQGSGAECRANVTPRHVVEIDSGAKTARLSAVWLSYTDGAGKRIG